MTWWQCVAGMGLVLAQVLTPVQTFGASVLPSTDSQPTDVLLSSLHPDQLESLLESRLTKLQDDVLRAYEEELKHHDRTIEKIHRAKRSTSHFPHSDFWHSYVFNTGVGNREEVKVENIESVGYLGAIEIVEVFPLNLPELPAIYKGSDGRGYIEVNGRMKVLTVRNSWTVSSSGCDCGDGQDEECACCKPGNCVCSRSEGYNGDTCVPCGTLPINCPSAGPQELEMDTAVGFHYYVQEEGLQRVVVTAKENTVTFYSADEHDLQEVHTLSIWQGFVTHLGYGETFSDHDGIIQRTRFLVIFGTGRNRQQFHQITVGTWDPAFSVGIAREWDAQGETMKVLQSEGRVKISVYREDQLDMYELKEDFWMKFQILKIDTLRAPLTSWVMFHTGFESYLTMASPEQLTVFIQDGAIYKQIQILSTSVGLSRFDGIIALSLKSCRGEVVLIAGSGRDVVAFVFDPRTATPQLKVAYKGTLSVTVSNWSTGFAYVSTDGSAKMILPTSEGAVLFLVTAQLEEVADPLLLETIAVNEAFTYIEDEYNRQKDIITTAEDRLQYSVASHRNVNADITILGGITVNQTLSTGELEAEKIVFPGTALAGGVTLQEYLKFVSELRTPDAILDQLLGNITYIESALDDAVPATGTSRTIGGLKTVTDPEVFLDRLITTSATLGTVLDSTGSQFPLDDVLSSIIRRDHKSKITGKKTFLDDLFVHELYTQYLDDVPVGDLVTTTGRETIEGAVFVNGLVAEDIEMSPGSTVGGIDLSDAVLLHEPADLGHVFSLDLEVENNVEVVSGLVDGVAIDYLYNNALRLSGGRLKGTIEFDSDLLTDHLEATQMMGIDIVHLFNSTVFRDEPSVMSGKLIVPQEVTIEGNLYARDINSKEFPGNYPLKTGDQPLVFTNRKNFANVIIDAVTFGAQALVNGIDPDRFVTRTTDQHVTGKKIFAHGVDIEGNLDIASKIIDGVNLDEVFAPQGTILTQADSPLKVIFTKPVRVSELIYDGKLNGMNFSAFAADLVYGNEETVRISGDKKFHQGLTVSEAEFEGTFNGELIESLVTSDTDQIIGGRKTFQTDVVFNDVIANLVDGVDLVRLFDNALYLNKSDQVVTGVKVFTSNVTAGSLSVEGKVKGIDFKNVVTRDGAQTFTAPQTLHQAQFSHINTHTIQLDDGFTVNGEDLSELAKRRVPLRQAVSHLGALVVDGPVTVIGTLTADYINGYDIRQLKESIVTSNVDSVIEGPVILSSLKVQGSVTTKDKVGGSGLNISAVSEGAVRLAGDNTFTGAVAFDTLELRGDVSVKGLVDGVNLQQLHEDAVFTNVDRLQIVTGAKVFRNGIVVKGNINTERTNDIDLSSRLFTLHTDQHITAPYSFLDLAASKNVYLQGLFNGIDIKRLALGALTRNDKVISGNVHFTKGVVVKNLEIRGSLNGVDVAKRLQDAIRLQESGVAVTGTKTFLANPRFKNLDVDVLNSVDFNDFLANVVTKNTAHRMTGTITVHGVVSAPWVTAENLTVDGLIDGVDYQRLKENVVYLSGEQDVDAELVFIDDIFVKGDIKADMLNSWKLEDYLTTSTEQTFSAKATFGSITTTYVDVEGKVNSWHLPTEKANTLLTVGEQTVTGLTTISGAMTVLGNLHVTGRVGRQVKVKLSDQVILLADDARVSGALKFTSGLTVASLTSSTGVINNVYVPDLYKNAWYVDRPVMTGARYFFNGHVTLKGGLESHGTVDGVVIGKAYRETTAAISMFQNLTQEFKVEFENVCKPIKALYERLQDCPYEGAYFRHEKDADFAEEHHSSITFVAWQITFLIMSYEGRCYSDVFVWNEKRRDFVQYQRLENSGYGHQWLLLQGTDKVLIAMAASSRGNSCSNTNTTIWLVTEEKVEVFQILAAGEHLSSESLPDGPLLHVHALHATLTYRYLAEVGAWRLLTESPPSEFGVEATGKDGKVVYFSVEGGVGKVRVNGGAAGNLTLSHATPSHATLSHAHLLTRGNTVILVLIVTTYTYKGPRHSLKVYHLYEGGPWCVAEEELQTAGQSSAFFAGNTASGAVFIVITQDNLCPVVYKLLGEILTQWKELTVPRVSWIQHFQVPSERFPTVMDNYLLLGRRDKTASIHYLVMKGASVPEKQILCES